MLASLKTALQDPAIPDELETFTGLALSHMDSSYRGKLATDVSGDDEWLVRGTEPPGPLAAPVYECLLEHGRQHRWNLNHIAIRHAIPCTYLWNRNQRFCSHGKYEGDSLISYKKTTGIYVGQIQDIFQHTRHPFGQPLVTEIFICVRRFKPPPPEAQASNPYSEFPDLGCWLYSNDFEEECDLIQPQEVGGHVARYPVANEESSHYSIFLSLDRVSLLRITLDQSLMSSFSHDPASLRYSSNQYLSICLFIF